MVNHKLKKSIGLSLILLDAINVYEVKEVDTGEKIGEIHTGVYKATGMVGIEGSVVVRRLFGKDGNIIVDNYGEIASINDQYSKDRYQKQFGSTSKLEFIEIENGRKKRKKN
tara:strand:- start:1183 stop:1518 length:336 start_codon:yes stop_codon:yes gene_type:complete